jgi:hypothetical protein
VGISTLFKTGWTGGQFLFGHLLHEYMHVSHLNPETLGEVDQLFMLGSTRAVASEVQVQILGGVLEFSEWPSGHTNSIRSVVLCIGLMIGLFTEGCPK